MAAKDAGPDPFAPLQTVFLELLQDCEIVSGQDVCETQETVHHGAIISYSGSLRSKLLELAPVALTLIAKTLHSDSPGMLSMPQLWQALHKHWSSPRAEADVEWNDDLVGFFIAVPRADILRSVHFIVREYRQLTGHTVLAVDFSKSGHPGQPRGKTKSTLKRVWIQDLPSIVDLSFSTGVFTAAGKCRLQIDGTCIGNQISPILAGLPVLIAEKPISFVSARSVVIFAVVS